MSSIQTSSILVELNISVWTANKVDKRVTKKATDDSSASYDAGQFKKNLLAGSTMRKGIADYAAEVRTWNNAQTMPWQDKGARLLPMTMFLDHKQALDSKKAYFDDQVSKLVTSYPQLMRAAERSLGDMFNPAEYPPADQIADKFALRYVYSPVPDADFRVKIEQEHIDVLKAQYAQASADREQIALQSIQKRLTDMLEGMSTKLAAPEGDGKKVFHGTFLKNAEDLCDLLAHLNISGDKRLDAARRKLKDIVARTDIDDVRKDVSMRTAMRTDIDEVLKQFNEW
jgi:hypothetical protein